ncbi:MAG: sodium:proton antiporter [Actinomycetota bacterium]|nr:sodium:proton antiporter [Actinomycetota bacterium]
MTLRLRRAVFLLAALPLGAFFAWGVVDLARRVRFDDLVGSYYLGVAIEEIKSYNVVTTVVFDYRGADTMIEQLILFAAVVGADLLLRRQPTEQKEAPRRSLVEREAPPPSAALQLAAVVLVGVSIFLPMYVILHAQYTPGGGFQSGVVFAGALLATYVAYEYTTFTELSPLPLVERLEALSAGAYVVVGAVGLAVAGTFLDNFLPVGQLGTLLSTGTVLLLNLIVGLEVTAGFVLIFHAFLRQTVEIREGAGR